MVKVRRDDLAQIREAVQFKMLSIIGGKAKSIDLR
jgi:hypothetical protein